MSQKRNHFRIPYPITERPRLVMAGAEFEVLDLSARGARVAFNKNSRDPGDGICPATIRLKDATTIETVATVHRREANRLVLRFATELPYSVIAGEERRLLKLFPRGASQPAAAAK